MLEIGGSLAKMGIGGFRMLMGASIGNGMEII